MASTRIRNEMASAWRGVGRAWRWFRHWRRTRPFWAGLFTIVGGTEILLVPLVPLPILIHEGIAGISGLLMGALMVVMGLSLWFAPHFKAFAGIATILFSLASFVTSNFGGLLIGMLLGIIGGPLALAWTSVRPAEEAPQAGDPVDGDPTDADRVDGEAGGTEPLPASERTEAGGFAAGDDAATGTIPAGDEASSQAGVTNGPGTSGADETVVAEESRSSRLPLLALALVALLTATAGPAGAPRAVADEAPVVNALVPTMHARTVDMSGLSFDGVVELSTIDGPIRTLKFSMSQVVMRDYSLETPGDARRGAPLRLTVGQLTLTSNVSFYTTRMSGRLGGLLPVTFTPDAPPPLVPPVLNFTDFTSEQVFVRSDTLGAKGLATSANTA